MDCFQYMNDIYFESFEQFAEDVNRARMDMLEVDSGEIKQVENRVDLKTAKELPNGRLSIRYRDIDFECFFHYNERKVLYVFLNGAKGDSLPMFSRWSYYKFLSGSMLNISDPMYRKHDKLKLGWYYGTEETDLQQIVSDLVIEVAKLIGIEQHNIIFVGSSGGGYASIACASRIPDAKSIAINPQIILHEHFLGAHFTEITGIDLFREEKGHRNNIIFYLQHNKSNRYFLFVNLRSKEDMKQVKNICDVLDRRVKYGLNILGNLIIWLYDADVTPWIKTHCVQENYCLFFLFEFIITHSDDMGQLKSYDSLYRLINEFYYDARKNEKIWRGKNLDIECYTEIQSSGKKPVLFGMGEYAEALNRELFRIEDQNYYHIQYVIDNDRTKKGTYHGLQIRHPSEIEDWTELYIIITSEKYHIQIRKQLEEMGLVYRKNFIVYMDLYQQPLCQEQ